jgi:hypothetical protein
MNEHWKEIAEELGSYDVDEYGTRFPALRRKLIVVDGTFYDPGEHVETELACKRIAELEAKVERLAKERDEARELCEDLDWMGDRCPSCGHRFLSQASHCAECHSPIPAPWQYPETMPDTCDCDRCVIARAALEEENDG